MIKQTLLTNQFLIAMPDLSDPNFAHSVTLICEHNEHGAMGVIINQPLALQVSEILQHLDIKLGHNFNDHAVFAGGPVHTEVGLILHPPQGQWESSIRLSDEICITSSKDILQAISQGEGPEKVNLVLGFAGWGPGQLERELVDNAWLTAPADADILFDTPNEKRWTHAVKSIGIDLAHLSVQTGHA